MKTSVRLTNANSVIVTIMFEESIGYYDHSDDSYEYFFKSVKDADNALKKAASFCGYFKNLARFLPGVQYKWSRITKEDLQEHPVLREIFE